jgi:hypothetical protein
MSLGVIDLSGRVGPSGQVAPAGATVFKPSVGDEVALCRQFGLAKRST